MPEINRSQLKLLGRSNHLHSLTIDSSEGCSQRLVALHDLVQTELKRARFDSSRQSDCIADVVKRIPGYQFVDEPKALLRERGWEDISFLHGIAPDQSLWGSDHLLRGLPRRILRLARCCRLCGAVTGGNSPDSSGQVLYSRRLEKSTQRKFNLKLTAQLSH